MKSYLPFINRRYNKYLFFFLVFFSEVKDLVVMSFHFKTSTTTKNIYQRKSMVFKTKKSFFHYFFLLLTSCSALLLGALIRMKKNVRFQSFYEGCLKILNIK